jgi:type IV fimbrial biogenesis protein FimT
VWHVERQQHGSESGYGPGRRDELLERVIRSATARTPMKSSRGFSLIELMTAVVVLAVLGVIALPSYRTFVLTQRVRQASYDLMSSLMLARSEAIKRNANVTIVRAAGGWSQGWVVSAGGAPIRTQDPYVSVIAISNSPTMTTITYSNEGRLVGGSTDFTIAPTDGSAQVAPRCVRIQLGGMPASKIGGC